jgi:hypothetical protein
MPKWVFQLAILGLVAIWVAQWLDWQSGIQDRQLNCHFRRRGV